MSNLLYFRTDTNMREKSYDMIVIGGGPVGVHTAYELDQRVDNKTDILAITETNQFGGLSQRSLEQYRYIHETREQTQMVDDTVKLYESMASDLGEKTIHKFPYIFTAASPEQRGEYKKIIDQTKAWGFDSEGSILTNDELAQEYPIFEQANLAGAAISKNAGRLYFDTVKTEMMKRSEKTTFKTGVRAEEIIFSKGKVTGVRTDQGEFHTDQVILAPGAGILNLQKLLPAVDVSNLLRLFEVTKRDLFYAPTHGIALNMEAFVIGPKMPIVRFEPQGATYGYADPQELRVTEQEIDPSPRRRQDLEFPAQVYDLLSECMPKYYSEDAKNTLAVPPSGHWSGYYPAFVDGQPAIGQLPGVKGLTIVAGSNHYGVMGGAGFGKIAADVVTGQGRVPDALNINRTPSPGVKSLVL